MRILHVIASLRTGGAEHLLVDLLPALRSMGHEVAVCSFLDVRTPFYDELERAGITVYTLGKHVYDPLHILRLRRLMKQFDIVHTHLTASQFFAAIACPKGVRLITTEHNTTNRRRHWYFRPVDRWMYGCYEQVICISDAAELNLRTYLQNDANVCAIYNGIDVQRFAKAESNAEIQGLYANKHVITMVAAFRLQKDQKTLIRAMHHLSQDYHLLLVGGGDEVENVKTFVRAEGLEEQVHFLGVRMDIPTILRASEVVVMSSHYEGLSLSNLEGMACGRPFVASDVDGLHEIVDGYGVLVPHEDSAILAEQIARLCNDKKYAEEVAMRCQQRAQMYDIQKMVDGYLEVYDELMSEDQASMLVALLDSRSVGNTKNVNT